MRYIKLIPVLMTLAIGNYAVAQDNAGIHQGGYSPGFQALMQQQKSNGNKTCQVPKTSHAACENPANVIDVRQQPHYGEPKECGEEGGSKGEIVGTDPFTGKTCRIEFYCYCGRDS